MDDGSRNNVSYRVVTDTNILISATLYDGTPEVVFRHVLEEQCLILSDYIVEEYVGFLKIIRPKTPQKWVRHMRQKLETFCYEDTVDVDEIVRDINDTNILKLAMAQRAIVVTNDKDLLEHKGESKVAIFSVAEYRELFNVI